MRRTGIALAAGLALVAVVAVVALLDRGRPQDARRCESDALADVHSDRERLASSGAR